MDRHEGPAPDVAAGAEAGPAAGRSRGPVGLSGAEASLVDAVRLRVRYSEGDQMGITYHGRYLDWFVIGRTELLRSLGLPYAELERQGLLLPVLEVGSRYIGSTRYDDVVQLETQLTEVGRTRLAFGYQVWRLPPQPEGAAPEDGEAPPTLVATGYTKHAFVGDDHRPFDVRKRFPEVWDTLAPLARLLASSAGDDVVAEGP